MGGRSLISNKNCIVSTILLLIFNSNHTQKAGKVNLFTYRSDYASQVGEWSFILVMSPSTVIITYSRSFSKPCGSVMCVCVYVCVCVCVSKYVYKCTQHVSLVMLQNHTHAC